MDKKMKKGKGNKGEREHGRDNTHAKSNRHCKWKSIEVVIAPLNTTRNMLISLH